MKKMLFFLFVLGSTFCANAQILKERTILLPDSSVVSYLTNQDKLSGLYMIKRGKAEIARGNYLDNKRVGNWYFFNKDKSLFLRYNYDAKKLLFVDDKTLAMANIAIKSDDAEANKNASVAIPIFSLEQYIILAAKAAEIAIPAEDKIKLQKKDILLIARVSDNGAAQYFASYDVKGRNVERKLNLGKDVIIEWIPSSYNGKTYNSEFVIKTPINLGGGKSESLHRRFDWL